MQKHFVTFLSPGTFVAEDRTLPIDAWDVDAAKKMADDVTERYGATPYGFRFTTRSRDEDDFDSKETARSGVYYLGGRVETVDDVRKRADPEERILLSNMEGNGWKKIIVNDNSWRWTQPLQNTDTVLDYTPPSKR